MSYIVLNEEAKVICKKYYGNKGQGCRNCPIRPECERLCHCSGPYDNPKYQQRLKLMNAAAVVKVSE